MYKEDELIKYGFKKEQNKYIYRYDIDSLYVLFLINKDIDIKVYDKDTDEEFIPFKLNIEGSYVTYLKEKIEIIKKDIINKCFINNSIKDDIIKYIENNFKIKGEYPWDDYDYSTYKVNNKWFALIMNIPYKSLGLNKNGNIDVINLKNDPIKIEKLIDNNHYFKAYHMNKKYWITVILDYKTDIDKLKELINDSYNKVKR